MIRRLLTFVVVAAVTCTASLWWLHDGDLHEAVAPALAEWDAPLLARDAGISSPVTDPGGVAPR